VAELYRQSRAKAAAYDKEQALRASQESLRHQAELLRLSFDALIVWRMNGGVESWNRGAEELYGYTEAEVRGRDIHEVLKTKYTISWREFESDLKKRGQWDGELCHRTRDGREVVVSSRQHIGRSADGGERILEIDRDISEQKQVQAELQRAHDELEEKVLQRTTDLKKANRSLLMVSQCDQALVQLSNEQELIAVICQTIQDEAEYPLVWAGVVDPDQEDTLRCVASAAAREPLLESVRAGSGGEALVIQTALRSIRAAVPLMIDDLRGPEASSWRGSAAAAGLGDCLALPLMDSRGTAFGAIVIYSETSQGFESQAAALLKELVDDLAFGVMSLRARAERDQAQRALQTTADKLRILAGELVRTEQRERQKIAQLLHDQFQQLLVAALYGLSSLENEVTSKGSREEIARLAQLLKDCIGISRSLTAELGHPALSEPDLCVGLEWLAAWMKEKHSLGVDVRAPSTLNLPEDEIRIMLMQATRELLFNVVKHAHIKRATVIAELAGDGSVRITVHDGGVGFDPGRVGQVVDATSGLGLFSLRERLALVGGGLVIESAPGKGSSITVWAPASVPVAQAAGMNSISPTIEVFPHDSHSAL
jgi:PAS domain S-box-containing protein